MDVADTRARQAAMSRGRRPGAPAGITASHRSEAIGSGERARSPKGCARGALGLDGDCPDRLGGAERTSDASDAGTGERDRWPSDGGAVARRRSDAPVHHHHVCPAAAPGLCRCRRCSAATPGRALKAQHDVRASAFGIFALWRTMTGVSPRPALGGRILYGQPTAVKGS